VALIALCSAKGSPGVTVTALALALSASRPVVLAECDPAGGDIAAGYLREVPLGERGLGQLTASLHRGHLVDDLRGQLVDLAPGKAALSTLVLPGLSDAAQAARWAEARRPGGRSGWAQLAELLTEFAVAEGYTVLADCGRLNAAHPPTDVLRAADAILMVLRPDLPAIRATAVAVAGLRSNDLRPTGLILIGDRPYGAREIADQLGTPVAATLPIDVGTATVLSSGGTHHRGQLLRAAARAGGALWRTARPGAAAVGQPTEVTHAR
jgi:MinD-like ATPase involved in chromosome partitioning or flagellar assembly